MLRLLTCLAMMAASPIALESSAAARSTGAIESVGAPPGFDEFERPREMLVDLFYGDRKIGEAMAVVAPGTLRFRDPSKLAELLPQLISSPALVTAFGSDLPSHAELVCS